jgi:hypothetical protein
MYSNAAKKLRSIAHTSLADLTECRHAPQGVGKKIQELKALDAKCLTCKSFVAAQNFGFNRCSLKKKQISAHNICSLWEKKK